MLTKKKIEKDFPKKLKAMKNNFSKNLPSAMEWFTQQEWSENDFR